jgi:hypothetical protein
MRNPPSRPGSDPITEISSLFRREAQLEGLARRISIKPSSGTSSGGGIGSAIAGGAAAATVGNLLNQIEGLFSRDDSDVYVKRDLASIIQDASSLPPSDKETVKTALMNKIRTLDEPEVATRALGAVGSAVAGGAAAAAVGTLLGREYSCSSRPPEAFYDPPCRNQQPFGT